MKVENWAAALYYMSQNSCVSLVYKNNGFISPVLLWAIPDQSIQH